MTSEGETLKTNEFLRRRKLRLQQVREQSKDIAKKIRQRAKVEKLRQVVEFDEKKGKDYTKYQGEVVKKLEELYAKGLENVGSSHQQARGLTQPVSEVLIEKVDLSHVRGREAAAELRKQKQQKLNELKKSLDRKVRAREAANVLSREKSAIAVNKLSTKSCSKIDNAIKSTCENLIGDNDLNDKSLSEEPAKNDMASQWEVDLPLEWEPNIPSLAIPQDESIKESVIGSDKTTDKEKRLNLFAVSDEMPSSLRGTHKQCDTAPCKPSSTLVSEYIKNRVLRLRESEINIPNKKHSDDLKALRQTIIRHRPIIPEGNKSSNVWHIADRSKFPMPVWHAEVTCQCESTRILHHKQPSEKKKYLVVTQADLKEISNLNTLKPVSNSGLKNTVPCASHTCFRLYRQSDKSNNKPFQREKGSDNLLAKKKSITMYNHSTRDARDVPQAGESLVHRDLHCEQDAYSQALSETTSACNYAKQKKNHDVTSKIAMTRQNVEKDYKETMEFLNRLPKNKSTIQNKAAFKDGYRIQSERENRQRLLQQEFKNIEQECRRQGSQGSKTQSRISEKSRTEILKSPSLALHNEERDLQYSWMPVPESDGHLTVHTVPTARSVQFRADAYHQYRSRHKHTPPTRDTSNPQPKTNKRVVEAVIFQNDDSLSVSSVASANTTEGQESSAEPIENTSDYNGRKLTDAERIIIYKILSQKHRKKKSASKTSKVDILAPDDDGTNFAEKEPTLESNMKVPEGHALTENDEDKRFAQSNNNPLGCDNLMEGIYEVPGCNHNQDNVESIFYENQQNRNENTNSDNGSSIPQNGGETNLQRTRKKCTSLKCKSRSHGSQSAAEPSSCRSAPPAPGFVQMADDGNKPGHFYIGATGLLKDDAYEVIIQLRKKDAVKETIKKEEVVLEQEKTRTGSDNAINTNKRDVHQDTSEHGPVTDPQISVSDPDSLVIVNAPAVNSTHGEESSEQQCGSTRSEDVPSVKTNHDRSASTSFIKDLQPEPRANSDPVIRPATSTFTQTTASSPGPVRPAYIHMSSSTSTAYMSPPEVLLPNFFNRSHESFRKSHKVFEDTDRHEDNIITKKHRCKKSSNRRIKRSDPSRISPTTDLGYSTYNVYKMKGDSNRCPKCNTRGDRSIGKYCKDHSQKIGYQSNPGYLSKSKWNAKNKTVQRSKSKTNSSSSKFSNRSYLNPRIKQYIHKLLSLNREGIKAIQILNQDCSSVNTPGSSIVNIPTNSSSKTTKRVNVELSLEQIKHILKQSACPNNNLVICHRDELKNNGSGPKKTTMRKINLKRKKMHRVKSLNISKKIEIKPCDVHTDPIVSYGTKEQPSSYVNYQASPLLDNTNTNSQRESSINNTVTTSNKVLNELKNVDEVSSSRQAKTITSSNKIALKGSGENTSDKCLSQKQPINTSTQTTCTVDDQMNFIQLAENKLQNMEKIADLTEKCSKRLSNLAKVLEEVRKNKSLAYSQVSTSDSASDSDPRSDKIVYAEDAEIIFPVSKDGHNGNKTDYESLLSGVTNPGTDSPETNRFDNLESGNSDVEIPCQPATRITDNCRVNNIKYRNKPPPALFRINLKRPQELVVPHELSTVIEVDSPLSGKFKSQSSSTNINQSINNVNDQKNGEKLCDVRHLNPELIRSILNKTNRDKLKMISTDSSDDSKLQMMDLNQFNEIMLRPFITLQEYAHDNETNAVSKCDSITKDNVFTDEISSLQSDGSLPDVVAELLKRKLITEPFKFDTASNVNSTTVSSESTLSVLALSKVGKGKSKSKLISNKENVGDMSDSLSISSNPDLEHAFKKLGMGWASSTLKKTKERLALSSSSNTSSSSLSHVKFVLPTPSKQDALATESVSPVPIVSKKPVPKRQLDSLKHAEQQTSFTNSMTVKEFLTKELSKKITFTDKSVRNDTNLEFVSLYETKLPEELKNSSQTMHEDNSGESVPSANNNRARTSTPVNIFKSVTYHSSSSSNISNGLFSNADDLSSVKLTSTSMRYQSTSEKDELTVPNCSLRMRKDLSDGSKTDSG